MRIRIGSRYWETKQLLIDRIRKNAIEVTVKESEGNICYFCEKPIEGRMKVLSEKKYEDGVETLSRYFLDDNCYHESRC